MSKIITDPKPVAEVLERGVQQIFPNRSALESKLRSGQRLKIYCGFDPSAPALHIGNAILLNKLSQFQDLGHEVIFLIGDFTGMIGDPTDKLAVRKKLTRQEVLRNCKNYQKQAAAYLRFSGVNAAKLKYNSSWHGKLKESDLYEIAANFTAQQIWTRDMFQARLKDDKAVYLHEFLYPLAQAYDSVALDVDLEIGGNDQMFNMLCGRDLMKAMGKKDKAVMTLKLITDAEGKKMGKTTGNALFLDIDADNMFGVVMSWPDEVIAPAFELCTKVAWAEVKNLVEQQLKSGKLNPRDAKLKLALEITKLVHGLGKAEAAKQHFAKTIQQRAAPDKLTNVSLQPGMTLLAAVDKFFQGRQSKTAIRGLFTQGAVSRNGQKLTDPQAPATPGVYKIGKLNWFKIIK